LKLASGFVRSGNIFPHLDKNWKDTAEYLKHIYSDQVLGPYEFAELYPNIDTPQFSYFKDINYYSCVILCKAQIEQYSDDFVASVLSDFHYAYGNDVFNVFLREPNDDAGSLKHIYDSAALKDKALEFVRSSLRSKNLYSWVKKKIFGDYTGLTVLVVSAHKFGNAGDDAITEAAIKIVEKAMPGVRVMLASPPFSRLDVDMADAVCLGGGGLVYDSCFYNAMNYSNYLLYAKSQGKMTFALGLGTQGVKSMKGAELFREALSTCNVVVVRNKRDEEVLVENCGVRCPVYTTNDVVFSFGKVTEQKKSAKKGPRLKVGVSLLESKNLLAANRMASYRSGCEEVIDYLCENYDVHFIMQSEDDRGLYAPYISKHGSKVVSFHFGNAQGYIDAYSDLDFCVTSRFHGFIFSLLAGTPVISVGSNAGKIDRLIKAAFPSLAGGYIPLRDFSFVNFQEKLASFLSLESGFVADDAELQAAVQSAEDTAKILSRYLKCLKE